MSTRPKVVFCYSRGSKELRNELIKFAKRNKIEIQFFKGLDDLKIVRLYNKAKLTVYPPVMEPFGLVPLESMACGIPVVGVKEGGIKETVIDGETGILTSRDAREYAQAIQRLLENHEIRNEYGKNGVSYVRKQWTWKKSVETFENYCFELLNKSTQISSYGR